MLHFLRHESYLQPYACTFPCVKCFTKYHIVLLLYDSFILYSTCHIEGGMRVDTARRIYRLNGGGREVGAGWGNVKGKDGGGEEQTEHRHY